MNNEEIVERRSSNRKVIISLILGILSIILFFCFGFILGVIGLIVGIIGLKEINRYKQERKKIAIAGIVCSGLGILIPIISIIIVIMAFAGGFGPGTSDFGYPLSNGYELNRNNFFDVYVSPKDGYTNESEIIPTKVVKIAWNNRFVIAQQQIIKESKISKSGTSGSGPVGKPTNTFHYWILDTKIRQAYGPFNQKTFDEKLKEFGIPGSLKLKDVESYKKNY